MDSMTRTGENGWVMGEYVCSFFDVKKKEKKNHIIF